MNKMQTNWPVPTGIAGIKAAVHEIAHHGAQFLDVLDLRGHLRIMAGGDQPTLINFHLEH